MNPNHFNRLTKWLHERRFLQVKRLLPLGYFELTDLGCSTGVLYDHLHPQFNFNYVGIDLNPSHPDLTNGQMIQADLTTYQFTHHLDIVIALETFEHIRPDAIVPLLARIRNAGTNLLICSVPVETGPMILVKNLGSWLMGYTRHAEYSPADTLWSTIYFSHRARPWQGGHRGFNWRQLRAILKSHFRAVQQINLPFTLFTTNVMFVCKP